MLVGAKPERPSANYKLNTLVSNRIRKAPSGKTIFGTSLLFHVQF